MPTLIPNLGGSVSPQRLPANEYVPAAWRIFGKVATSDGTHPSALREVHLDIDKDVRINARGYPICRPREIDEQNTRTAAKACAGALIGRGKASVELALPESAPMRRSSRLLVFNGGERDGAAKLLIHAFVTAPTPSAILTVVEVTREGTGLRTISKIPVIAEGEGSLLDFEVKIGKVYAYNYKRYGYFEAKCPDGVFKASVRRLHFKNEVRAPGVAAQTVLKGGLAIPCTTEG
jgi:hypothetical protein